MNKRIDKNRKETEKLEQLKKEAYEWKGKYLRALADYQNLERRTDEQRDKEVKFAAKNLVIKILPILDILDQLERVLKDKGLELAVKQLRDVLTSEKVEKIEVVGKKFDPHIMECVEVVESDKDEEVVEEAKAGYMMWDKVIRVAKVKVGKKRDEKTEL